MRREGHLCEISGPASPPPVFGDLGTCLIQHFSPELYGMFAMAVERCKNNKGTILQCARVRERERGKEKERAIE